jgi:sporulation protein YlmC with PRC-barrel domain
MKIEINAPVRTRDGRIVGEVHRVLVDLEDKAVTGIVVLKGRLLSRDVLVPLDAVDIRVPAEWVEHVDESRVYVAGDRIDIETGLGPQSRARLPSWKGGVA